MADTQNSLPEALYLPFPAAGLRAGMTKRRRFGMRSSASMTILKMWPS